MPNLVLSLVLAYSKVNLHVCHGFGSLISQIQPQFKVSKSCKETGDTMGFQQHGKGEVGLSGITLGSKNEYKRMHSELPEGDDDVLQQEARRNSTRKYVIACATFASLNNVLLGYGMLDLLRLLPFFCDS